MTVPITEAKLSYIESLCDKSVFELSNRECNKLSFLKDQLESFNPPPKSFLDKAFSALKISSDRDLLIQRVDNLKIRLTHKQEEVAAYNIVKFLKDAGFQDLLIDYRPLMTLQSTTSIAEYIASRSEGIPFLERKLAVAKADMKATPSDEELNTLMDRILNARTDDEAFQIYLEFTKKFQSADQLIPLNVLFIAKGLTNPRFIERVLFGKPEQSDLKNVQHNLNAALVHLLTDSGVNKDVVENGTADSLILSMNRLNDSETFDEDIKSTDLTDRISKWSESLKDQHPSFVRPKEELKKLYQKLKVRSQTHWWDHLLAIFNPKQKEALEHKKELQKKLPEIKSMLSTLKIRSKPFKYTKADCEAMDSNLHLHKIRMELRNHPDALENKVLDEIILLWLDNKYTDAEGKIKEAGDITLVTQQLVLRGIRYPVFIHHMLHVEGSFEAAHFKRYYNVFKSEARLPSTENE